MSANGMTMMLARKTAALGAATIMLAVAQAAYATPSPVKLALSGQIKSGFEYAEGVAVNNYPGSPGYGDVYVVDKGHHRVQVLSPTGTFIEMFGHDVNATTEGNVCTAVSGNKCQTGADGVAGGEISEASSIAIDPSSGDVYVAEDAGFGGEFGLRVQEFTAEGKFVLEIGKEVNVVKDKGTGATQPEKNLCSEVEVEKGGECGAPALEVPGSNEDSDFNFESVRSNLLAVGGTGSKDTLYVGDERRVQEFDASTGVWIGEIPLTSISDEAGTRVQALAFDEESGHVDLVYAGSNLVREFDPVDSTELTRFAVKSQTPGTEAAINDMAMNESGGLAVVVSESAGGPVGWLYDAVDGVRVTGFTITSGLPFDDALAFNHEGDLYAVGDNHVGEGEMLDYTAEPIANLTLVGSVCKPGIESDSSATFACAFEGEANSESVSETEVFFEWGTTATLGETTPGQGVAATGPVSAVAIMHPNETYYYRLAGFDHNVKPPEEAFSTEEASLTTPTVAPNIVGSPSASVVRTSSAVLFGELDPNNAHTEYLFEYSSVPGALAECAGLRKTSCVGVEGTPILTSAVYGKIGAVTEVSGLQPSTVYHYRLSADDESRSGIVPTVHFAVTSPESSFETAPAPQPSAQTGGYGGVTSTSAVISGAVNPDGLGAGYAFEVGVYNGAMTQYTVVSSGTAGSGNEPVGEGFELTGLQPGTTYAYRISVSSGYILNESHTLQGATAAFTTAGVANVLAAPASLAILPTPPIAIPGEVKTNPLPPSKCKRSYTRNKHGKCVKVKPKKKARKAHKTGRGHGKS